MNRLYEGFVAVPVIDACSRRGLFSALSDRSWTAADLAQHVEANEGRLSIALRLLDGLGWVEADGEGAYRLSETGAALAQQIPEDLPAMLQALPAAFEGEWAPFEPWLDRCAARWSTNGEPHPLSDLLDGVVLVPILAGFARALGGEVTEERVKSSGFPSNRSFDELLSTRGWSGPTSKSKSAFTEILQAAGPLEELVGYWPLLRQVERLLFANTGSRSDAVDGLSAGLRYRGAAAAGTPSAFRSYCSEMAELLVAYFDSLPIEEQPTHIADIGGGDAGLLLTLYQAIEERSRRGQLLERHPLTLVAIGSGTKAHAEAEASLGELPHLLLQVDSGNPLDLAAALEACGVNPKSVLFVRAFGTLSLAEGAQSLVEQFRSWRSLVGPHGLLLLEAHSSGGENPYLEACRGFAGQAAGEAPTHLLAAAEAGLLARSRAVRRFPRGAKRTSVSLSHLLPSEVRIRPARLDDVPALVALDEASQAPGLRNTKAQIEGRIADYPQGQLILEREGEVIGAIFSQRIASADVIDGVTMETAERLHRPDGPVGQLLLILVHPDHRQSLGAEDLLGFALDYLSLVEGVGRVVGVTRCRDFVRRGDPAMSHADYVAQKDSFGRPLDPVLLMHAAQGARIERVMKGYRKGDLDNGGYGVLVSYDLDRRQRPAASAPQPQAAGLARDVVKAKVREAVGGLLGADRAGAFEAGRPFMEMGLESLDLLTLRRMLSEAMGEPLDSSFFFRHSTPDAVVRYFTKEEAPRRDEGSRRRLRRPKAQATAGAMDGEGYAIVGMAGRFPGAPSVADFWALLAAGKEGVGEISPERWRLFEAGHTALGDLPRRAGLLTDVDRFDAAFFRIAPREAALLDPQQRLLLEVVWHALEDAGQPPDGLAGSLTGFFVGLMGHDYETLLLQAGPKEIDGHFASGCAGSIAAGRIAYFFDWQGPAVTIDTACSSSLVAVHQACRSLEHGDCRQAIAAGVNLTLAAPYSLSYWQAGMLSPDGRCKTFDAAADGYVRAEGCAAVVLKRLDDAQADGDRILAVVRGSAVNQDGTGIGLTAPNENAQSQLITEALRSANVAPAEVGYLECHGTGTKLGDPIEVRAAARALGVGRPADAPLLLGAVKANIGHLEGAAGLAGLIKTVLALRHDRIPGQANYRSPNPLIPWEALPVSVVAEATPWPASETGRRLAGVSSFGFSGTNAHVVVEGYGTPDAEEPPLDAGPWQPVAVKWPTVLGADLPTEESEVRHCFFLSLSGKSDDALAALADSYRTWLEHSPGADPGDLAYSAGACRSHFTHRAALVYESLADLSAKLTALADGEAPEGVLQGRAEGAPKLAFLFTGQGSQYLGMGKGLYESEPVVRAVLDRCDAVVRELRGQSLLKVMFEGGDAGSIDDTAWTQPALFALEVALVELYRSAGIEPAVVLGHSVGEYAAAYTAGVFGLEEGLRLIAARGTLMGALPAGGAMAAIFAEPAHVAALVEEISDGAAPGVEIASDNGRHQVVSGPRQMVDQVVERFSGEGVRTAPLQTSHAFHSALLDPMLAQLEERAGAVKASTPRLPLISNVTGAPLSATEAPEASYWRRHARQPVQFAKSMAALAAEGVDLVLEVGPHPVLSGMLQLAWPESSAAPTTAASLRRGRDEGTALATAFAGLYVAGADLRFAALHAGEARRKLALPAYPFQRRRFWAEALESKRSAAQLDSAVLRRLVEGEEEALLADLGLDGGDAAAQLVLRALTKRYAAEQASASLHDLLYRVIWETAATPRFAGPSEDLGGWLVLGGDGGLDAGLVEALQARGARCRLLDRAKAGAAVTALLQSESERQPQGIVMLWGHQEASDPSDAQAMHQLLAVVAAVIAAGIEVPISLVTRGAHAIEEGSPAVRPEQRALWGLGRVLDLEHPALLGKMIDLPIADAEGSAEALVEALLAADHEEQVALRGGERLVPRLVPLGPMPLPGKAVVRSDVSYLITGGLGALGLAIAEWLAGEGAKHLVLVARRRPGDAALARIEALRDEKGCQVETVSVDVGDAAAVEGLIGRFGEAKGWPALGGVIHAAGVERVDTLAEMTAEAFDAVWQGKVKGAWNLHQATRRLADLDVFLCLSSIASVWGSQGQAHYASANAFLDGLAAARRAEELPGTVVNFGPWSDGGMADPEMQAWLARAGIALLSPAEGLGVIEACLGKGLTDLVAARVDWSTFAAVMEARRTRPIFAKLRGDRPSARSSEKTDLAARVEQAPTGGREALLTDEVRGLTAAVLDLDPVAIDATTGFFDLGMDSLMAVELRRRLERAVGAALPATLAMDHPNAEAVAAFLLQRHFGADAAPAAPALRRHQSDEAIAIVGMSCRLPGAVDLEAFWSLLERQGDGITEIPKSRFDVEAYYDPDMDAAGKMYTRKAGLIEGIDLFDPQFFAISPREAESMDPQQRLLLEGSYEALERAGISAAGLKRSRTGVYVGMAPNEYTELLGLSGQAEIDSHFATGRAVSAIAGRVAFTLGLEGPALSVDTACSSALVALHQACLGLHSGDCDLALAGGVNTLLSPEMMIATCRARMLSADGSCKTFDARADGYVRAEGVGVVVLKRLSDAERDGERILAVIRGSAVNQDGASSGLTVPNGPAQERVIADALGLAGVAPAEVSFLECHGTGTSLGDPIEVQAAAAVYGQGRPAERPLLLGAAKANVGHLESGSGMVGVIKTVLAQQKGVIPGQVHYQTPNPHIPWETLPVAVVAGNRPWPEGRRLAGVSSFGFTGTNAHVILEDYGEPSSPSETAEPRERRHRVLPLSAKNESALKSLADSYRAWLDDNGDADPADLAFTAGVGRSHFAERAALVFEGARDLRKTLSALASGESPEGIARGHSGRAPKLAFLFTGQGSQYLGMGQQLYRQEPVVRQVLDRCDAVVRELRGASLLEVMFEGGVAGSLDDTAWTQPALYALEVALVELYRSAGVEAAVVLGHSVGEYAAAYAAGVFGLEEGLRLIAARGSLMSALPAGGSMAAIFADPDAVAEALLAVNAGHAPAVEIASDNGRHQVVSGPAGLVQAVIAHFEAEGLRCEPLNTSHAFHSALLEPMLGELEAAAEGVTALPPSISLISNVTGETLGAQDVQDGSYWRRHARQPVQFAEGVARLAELDVDLVVEIGPHPVLSAMMAMAWPESSDAPSSLASLRRGGDEGAGLASVFACLYASGTDLNHAALFAGEARRKLALPTYPFQRQRYWPEAAKRKTGLGQGHPLLGRKQATARGEVIFDSEVSLAAPAWLAEHRVFDRVVFPGAGYVTMAATGALLANKPSGTSVIERSRPLSVTNLQLHTPLVLAKEEELRELQLLLARPQGHSAASSKRAIEIYSRTPGDEDWTLHADGEVELESGDLQPGKQADLPRVKQDLAERDIAAIYQAYEAIGIGYGPTFRSLQGLWACAGEALGQVRLSSEQRGHGLIVHPAVLDGCLQAFAAAVPESAEAETFMPFACRRIAFFGILPDDLYCHLRLRDGGGVAVSETLTADIDLHNEEGLRVGLVEGFTFKRATRQALKAQTVGLEDWIYQIEWRPQPLAGAILPAAFLPTPDAIAEEMRGAAAEALVAEDLSGAKVEQLIAALEQLSQAYTLQALQQLGWQPQADQRVTAEGLVEALGIQPNHLRLTGRLLEILSGSGLLAAEGEGAWRTLSLAPAEAVPSDPDALQRELAAKHPEGALELELLGRCGRALGDVLRGRSDPLALLFSETGASAGDLYSDAPVLRLCNRLIASSMRALVRALPAGRRLRVLEIGAGTGSATAQALPELPAEQTDYLYTDISAAFFSDAEARFAEAYPFVDFRVLDIERDPLEQGFSQQGYDLIVASNVLHTTRDIGATLSHCRSLLAPQGTLVMMELLRKQAWLDLTFGLLDGWWRFQDDYRPDYALMDQALWQRVLGDCGFGQILAIVPGRDELAADAAPSQGVMLARATSAIEEPPGLWVLTADREGAADLLAEALAARNQTVVLAGDAGDGESAALSVHRSSLHPDRREDWVELLQDLPAEPALRCIVHLTALDGAGPDASDADLRSDCRQSLASALALTQAVMDLGLKPSGGLRFLTRQAQVMEPAPGEQLAGAGLWGFVRTLATERPDLDSGLIDVGGQPEAVVEELLRPDGESHVAYRQEGRFIARLARWREASPSVGLPDSGAWRLIGSPEGRLEDLAAEPLTVRALEPGKARVSIEASGLNFRDLLDAMGVSLGVDVPLGAEFCGRVLELGPKVSDLEVGQRVVGFAPGTFASEVVTRAELLAPAPDGLTSVQLATIPVVFVTALIAFELSALKRGERVLIHAGSGGVGLAASQLAREIGAEIFVTASAAKQGYLRSIGIANVYDSRSTDFAEQIRAATGDQGVDMVLNSLTGEGFIEATLSCLAKGGRFVEIAKRNIWSLGEMAAARPDVAYEILEVDRLTTYEPASIAAAFKRVMAHFQRGQLQPLPATVWPMTEAAAAMRFMRAAKHIGKIVLRVPPLARGPLDPERSYLITGGLGGIGLEVAQWLAGHGARHIVLNGRRAPGTAARKVIQDLEAQGVAVRVIQADVGEAEQVSGMLTEIATGGPPLAGLFHSVGVLSDSAISNQDWESFRKVLAPKVFGAWSLHRATRDLELDLFVLFSSTAGVVGNAGQSNHAAANAFLDQLALHRRALGLPAQSIAWGPWSGLGKAEEERERIEAQLSAMGVGWIDRERGIEALDSLLRYDSGMSAVLPVDWSLFGERHQRKQDLFADLLAEAPRAAAEPALDSSDLIDRLQEAEGKARHEMLCTWLGSEVEAVLRLREPPDPRVGFFDMGMDSLTTIEFSRRLERTLGIKLDASLLFSYPNLTELTDFILSELVTDSDEAAEAADESSLSDDDIVKELESLLDKM